MSFFAMNLVLLFAIVSFIIIVFELAGFVFVFELMLLLVSIFLIAFAMFIIYRDERHGWTILGATLILVLLDTFFIILFSGKFGTPHITTIFFSVIGLLVILLNIRSNKDDKIGTEDYQAPKEYYPYDGKAEQKESKQELKQEIKEEIKREMEEKKPSDKTKITKAEIRIRPRKAVMPKFVGSTETKKFHTAKCGWARLMKRKNKVFFNSRKRAQKAGFKAHECVK